MDIKQNDKPKTYSEIKYFGGYPKFFPSILTLTLYPKYIVFFNSIYSFTLKYKKIIDLQLKPKEEALHQIINPPEIFDFDTKHHELLLVIEYQYSSEQQITLYLDAVDLYSLYQHIYQAMNLHKCKSSHNDEYLFILNNYKTALECLENAEYSINQAMELFSKKTSMTEQYQIKFYVTQAAALPEIEAEDIIRDSKKAQQIFINDNAAYQFSQFSIKADTLYINDQLFCSLGDIFHLSLALPTPSSIGELQICTIQGNYRFEFTKEIEEMVLFYQELYDRVSKIKYIEQFTPENISYLHYVDGHPNLNAASYVMLRFGLLHLVIHSNTKIVNIAYENIIDINFSQINTQNQFSIIFTDKQSKEQNMLFSGEKTYEAYLALYQTLESYRKMHPEKNKKSHAKLITVICEYCNGMNTVEADKDSKCAYCGAPIPNPSKKEKPKSKNQSTANDIPFEQLMQLKTLLDNGIITQEEFDAKKKQLLGL